MLRIANVSITERAAIALDVRMLRTRLGSDDVLTMGYIVSYTKPDGTTVEGFVPGYSLAAGKRDELGQTGVLVRLPNGMEIYVMVRPRPGYELYADEHYLIDLASETIETFSISRVS